MHVGMLLKIQVSSREFRKQGSICMGKIGYQFFFFKGKKEPFCAHLSYMCRFAFFPRRRSRSRDQKRTNLRFSENSVLIPLTTLSLNS